MKISKGARLWLHSLVAAVVSGAANGVSVMIVSPTEFNLGTGLTKLGEVILISALVGLAMFLKQSPLPPEEADPVKPDQAKGVGAGG